VNHPHETTAMATSSPSDGDRGTDGVEEETRPAADEIGSDADQSSSATSERELGRQLAGRAGDAVSVELDRALRTFDDGSGVPPEARRVLSTMAIRIAVGVLRAPAVAVDDGRDVETVAELFRADD
jgi:hypothetical protein